MPFSAAPDIKNRTPFVFEPLFMVDEDGRPLLVTLLKATFEFRDDGSLAIAQAQQPILFAGEHWGDPNDSSYRLEPDCAFMKGATDVVMVGHAVAPDSRTRDMLVELKVGPVEKAIRVWGDRFWQGSSFGAERMSRPELFERIPLIYERAYGGRDAAGGNSQSFEPRNPVGLGFSAHSLRNGESLAMPNLEDPQRQVRSMADRPRPAGFGFTCPHWQPRSSFAGTYDGEWLKSRSPLLPADFNRQFFNAASPGLVAPGYLRGDEDVVLVGVGAKQRIDFKLPGIPPPRIVSVVRNRGAHDMRPNLDTVFVDADARTVTLSWRDHLPIRDVPRDVVAITVECELAASIASSSLA